jgi:hypothetical protein
LEYGNEYHPKAYMSTKFILFLKNSDNKTHLNLL